MASTSQDNSCLAQLRDLDRDRYIAALLSPADKREAIASIYCFNAEIARVSDVTREVLTGEIRLQWWRDALEGKSIGDANAHPVAGPLLATIADYALPIETFLNLIEARVFDLYDDSFDTMNSFEGYAGETASALIQLASLILDPDKFQNYADTAGHAGVAQAIAGSLMMMPVHRSRNQMYVPLEILNAVGISRDEFLAGDKKDQISAAIEIFATKGLEHLRLAKVQKIDPILVSAYLPVSVTETVLKRALKLKSNVLSEQIQPSELQRYWLMWKAGFKKSI